MDNDLSKKLGAILSDPSMMDKIKNIAQNLGDSSAPPREEHREERCAECSSCPHAVQSAAQPFFPLAGKSGLSKSVSDIRALLTALKPYLDDARCARMDKILGIIKIAEIMGYIK